MSDDETTAWREELDASIRQAKAVLRKMRADARALTATLAAAEAGSLKAGRYLPKGDPSAAREIRANLAGLELKMEVEENKLRVYEEELAALPAEGATA